MASKLIEILGVYIQDSCSAYIASSYMRNIGSLPSTCAIIAINDMLFRETKTYAFPMIARASLLAALIKLIVDQQKI